MNQFPLCFVLSGRWLVSVIHASLEEKKRILMDIALGFDTFLVLRHGNPVPMVPSCESSERRLGCYFCNDVAGVSNSMKDRTLDQQCTVTRPGLAYMAAAWGVEMMVALLQCDQERRGDCARNPLSASTEPASPMEEIPHQIRGSLATYQQFLPMVSIECGCTLRRLTKRRAQPLRAVRLALPPLWRNTVRTHMTSWCPV